LPDELVPLFEAVKASKQAEADAQTALDAARAKRLADANALKAAVDLMYPTAG